MVDLIEHETRFWSLLAVAAVAVAVGAYVAARYRPPTVDKTRGVARFAGVYAVALFLFAFLVGIGAAANSVTGSLTDRFGFNPFLVFVFSAFWAIAGALAMLWVPPRIRPMPTAAAPSYQYRNERVGQRRRDGRMAPGQQPDRGQRVLVVHNGLGCPG